MFKQAVRRLAGKTRDWLEHNNSALTPITKLPERVSYEWLNRTLLPTLLAEGGATFRPNYTWGVLQAVYLAKVIGFDRVSLIEFGVAGGRGLTSLDQIAKRIESLYEVEVDVYGFDAGDGLPKPKDYRDLPNLYSEGTFVMDIDKLKNKLHKAKLILGLVNDTITDFIDSKPAPIAFVSVDLDLYSSTIHALKLLNAEQDLLLPRIYFYFDDIMGRSCCEFNGERCAITEFNAAHEMRKIAPIYGLKYFLPKPHASAMWTEKFFMAHMFDHELYGCSDGLANNRALSLADTGS